MKNQAQEGCIIRKGWTLRCDKCRFMYECPHYGASMGDGPQCKVVDINHAYYVIESPTFRGSKQTETQVFTVARRHNQDEGDR